MEFLEARRCACARCAALRARASANRVEAADEPFAPFELECIVPALVLVFTAVVAARDVASFMLPFAEDLAGDCVRLVAALLVLVMRFALLRFFAIALSAL
jgi:hypothetical protein